MKQGRQNEHFWPLFCDFVAKKCPKMHISLKLSIGEVGSNNESKVAKMNIFGHFFVILLAKKCPKMHISLKLSIGKVGSNNESKVAKYNTRSRVDLSSSTFLLPPYCCCRISTFSSQYPSYMRNHLQNLPRPFFRFPQGLITRGYIF